MINTVGRANSSSCEAFDGNYVALGDRSCVSLAKTASPAPHNRRHHIRNQARCISRHRTRIRQTGQGQERRIESGGTFAVEGECKSETFLIRRQEERSTPARFSTARCETGNQRRGLHGRVDGRLSLPIQLIEYGARSAVSRFQVSAIDGYQRVARFEHRVCFLGQRLTASIRKSRRQPTDGVEIRFVRRPQRRRPCLSV